MNHDHHKTAAKLGSLLLKKGWVITTAESCTGGGIAHALTSVSGASSWFHGALITYSNHMKTHLLGVGEELLCAHGAVSVEVVQQMLSGALKQTHANIAIAVSGIAGPSGGSLEKPVGTVVIGVGNKRDTQTESYLFEGDRDGIREQAIARALMLTIDFLERH